MTAILRHHPVLALTLLMFGVLSTLVLDFWATNGVRQGTWVEELFIWAAFFPRIFTFGVLFISCRLVADTLPGRPRRTLILGSVWSLIGICLAAVIWWHLAFAEDIHRGGAFRFTPDRPVLPNWLYEAVVSGKNYSWEAAITREVIGIAAVSYFVAYYLAFMARTGRVDGTYFAPFVSYLFSMIFYGIIAPWSFIWGPDAWVGDALLGAMHYNGLFFWKTICFGGLTGPAIWVSLIAISNLVLVMFWARETAQ